MNEPVFDIEKCKRLEERYNEAIKNKEKDFKFEGHKYKTEYTKSILENLHELFQF